MNYDNIPSELQKYITYERILEDYRPQKDEPNHTQLKVGLNLLGFSGGLITTTADTTTAKILWNSVFSTPNVKYIHIYILKTPRYTANQV